MLLGFILAYIQQGNEKKTPKVGSYCSINRRQSQSTIPQPQLISAAEPLLRKVEPPTIGSSVSLITLLIEL